YAAARRFYRRPVAEWGAALLLEAGAGGGLRWASALGGSTASPSAVATVLGRVLNGDRAGLVWSGSTGGGGGGAAGGRRRSDGRGPGGPGDADPDRRGGSGAGTAPG